MSNPFICLEDEITLRRAFRSVYKNEGMTGVYQAMGELVTSLKIAAEIAKELLEEENKKGGSFNV